ncbi:hypothetical protein KXS11_05625 [Plantibacter flavus]|uniref:hypothetical protein n=1 Tax=Plantibacter flavus TaxID=150123 RepID=UPI003F156BFE
MTTHLDTSPTVFSLPTLHTSAAERVSAGRAGRAERGRMAAFIGVILGNVVLWSTAFIAVGLTLALQLGLVGVVVASLLR